MSEEINCYCGHSETQHGIYTTVFDREVYGSCKECGCLAFTMPILKERGKSK